MSVYKNPTVDDEDCVWEEFDWLRVVVSDAAMEGPGPDAGLEAVTLRKGPSESGTIEGSPREMRVPLKTCVRDSRLRRNYLWAAPKKE